VVHGCQQAVSEEKALKKLYQALNELKIHTCTSVLKLSSLLDLQHKAGELLLSLTFCPSIIILENAFNCCI
jgi:hypothetical protein